ncbi:hypothetical protein [Kutzneria albida]|uniref:TauD/TfdA-like domain-containing protein n=1 Tax=Kutzneria albida DSM 43870 TaxID=1449976 RepID=W5WCJ0_9PSEU|nr:hypothetical protein [Kutzneria albida]AHH98607.1 hypothetical protein KALB_5245 [Kutzneria albida DSM 43870]
MSVVVSKVSTILGIPELSIPSEWSRVLNAWPRMSIPDDVVEGVTRARASGLVLSAAATGTFLADLRMALTGPSKSVVVTYEAPDLVAPVVSLIGAVLGDVAYLADKTLGGPASVVPTGGIDRYEQAWHTDSTPWDIPNRWSVLGLLREDPVLERRATAILPWYLVAEQLHADDELPATLRSHLFSWREQYDGLPELHAPILGSTPRWFRPALAALIDDPERRVAACVAVDLELSRATTWYEAEVSSGRVLVFDNHAVLHRGPAVQKSSIRTLLRLKVNGMPRQ